MIRYGIAWRAMPNDLPPWAAVYQQAQRWMAAGCFKALAHDLRAVLRMAAGRQAEPSAAIFDSRTLRSTPALRQAQERHAGRLRRCQAQARLQAAYGGGHPWPSARPACHAG